MVVVLFDNGVICVGVFSGTVDVMVLTSPGIAVVGRADGHHNSSFTSSHFSIGVSVDENYLVNIT